MKSTIIGALIALFVGMSAMAQTSITPEELEKRVRELEQKIAAMAEQKDSPELAEVKGQIEVLSREIESLKLQQTKVAVAADTAQHGLGAAASKVYRAEPGLSFGGYGEMLYENYDEKADDGAASGKTDQLDFLRAILYAGYKFSDKVVFNSEIEFEHGTTGNSVGEVSVEFAYLDFLVRPEFNVRAGMVLLPVGFVNELHEPTAYLGARRPQVEQRIIPTTWRENGAGVFGDAGDFTYRAYIVNGYDSAKFTASGLRDGRQKGARAKAEDFAIVGRLDWHPVEGFLLGASAYSGDSGQGRAVAGEEIGGNVTTTELHAEGKYRGLTMRALWASTSVDDVALINQANGLTGNRSIGEEQDGWYAEVGYDVTSVFPLGQSSLIPYYRYEEFNTQKDVPAGFSANPANDVEISTFGVAWKPIPQAVIKVDYQDNDDGANKGVNQVNAALGYIFSKGAARRAQPPASRRNDDLRTLILTLALLATALPLAAKTYMTQQQALDTAFGKGVVLERQTLFLSAEESKAARGASGVDFEDGLIVRYVGRSGATVVGYVYFDAHRVRTLPETLMIVVRPDGAIDRIEILSFSEPEDYLP
ncbi:MAG: DUF2730 domain-containing protein, partial [Thermoanaerobaculia bacterium]|nr:DUF2730 domain-containing protein [Thermoanaerobaculia bacterium]